MAETAGSPIPNNGNGAEISDASDQDLFNVECTDEILSPVPDEDIGTTTADGTEETNLSDEELEEFQVRKSLYIVLVDMAMSQAKFMDFCIT